MAKLEDPNSFYLIDSIIKNVQQLKIPNEIVIRICCRAASQLSNSGSVMPQILATWQKFVPETLLVQIETETGIKRHVTEKVKQFWREFKPKSEGWKLKTQSLLDEDNSALLLESAESTKQPSSSAVSQEWSNSNINDDTSAISAIMKVYGALGVQSYTNTGMMGGLG